MAKYRITGPDGATYEINAPDGTSEQDVLAFAQSKMGSASAPKPQATAAPKESVGTIPAALEGIGQSATFGFSDELEGAGRALYGKLTGDQRSLTDLYSEGVAKPRQRIKDASETNPAAFYAGEIGAGFLVPGGLAGLGVKGALAGAAGSGLKARTIAGGKDGLAYGAAYGAGKAEGDLQDQLTSVATSSLLGGGIGAALPGAIDAASAFTRGATTPFRAAYNPQGFAGEKLAEATARDLSRTDNAAGGAAQRLQDRFQDMSGVTESVRMMDAAGENVRGFVRAAANVPNQQRDTARRIVDTRQANQWARIEGAADKSLAPGREFGSTIDDIVAHRDAAASPLFREAFATRTEPTKALQSVFERPTMQRVGEKVKLRLEDEGVNIETTTRNTEWLHRVKLELDDLIGQSKRAEQMGNSPQAGFDTKTLSILKKDLLNAIDNPTYKQALKTYAGPSALKNAAEMGEKEFLKSSSHEIRAALKELTPSEAEMYRLGAKQAVFTRLESPNVNRDLTDGFFGSAGIQKKLQALFPDQKSFREFQKALIVEAKMADSRKALQGNSTTAKQLAEGDQAGKNSRMLNSAMNAMTGKLEPVLNLVAQGYNRFTGMTPSVANEVLRMAMSKDPSVVNSISQKALERADQVPRMRALLGQKLIGSGTAVVPNQGLFD
jgi:hypothetical protein